MPIFEFKCIQCGKSFEKLIFKREEEKNVNCPFCKSLKIEKILTGSYCINKNSSSSNKYSSCGGKFGLT